MHALGASLKSLGVGAAPFSHISAAQALRVLRATLSELKVSDAALYRTHDLRRGHARDLQVRGGVLREILAAGDWRSPAFLRYLDVGELERGAVAEAHLDDSSDDEEDAAPTADHASARVVSAG